MAFDQYRGRSVSPETVHTDLEISISQVHRWIGAGYITAVKLGHRTTRIDGDSLADFLTSRMETPRSPRGRAAKRLQVELTAQA